MKTRYEEDDAAFPAQAYKIRGYGGIAWYVLGWETEPDEDTWWSGFESRTEKVVAMMVGDDRHFTFEKEDLTPLTNNDYCGGCGQIGCQANKMG